MLQEVMAYCRDQELIRENENIVAGISGGADSMCLLFLLHQMQPLMHLQLVAVHVNHGIREEAGEDAAYVESMCNQWDIPFFLYEVDAPGYAREHQLTEEEAGRTLRYQAFEEILQKYFQGEGKIAVAHNSNDRSETVLFHLFRGTGIKGLAGITNARAHVIRPILKLDRSRIEAYLAKNDIAYCIDRTNAEDTYTRNRIRRHIIAYAREHICARANEHINEAADLLEETEELLQKLAGQVYDRSVRIEKTGKTEKNDETAKTDRADTPVQTVQKAYYLNIAQLAAEEQLLVRYCIMRCISELTQGGKDITSAHIQAVAGLLTNQVGKRVDLPYGLQAVREYEDVRLFFQTEQRTSRRSDRRTEGQPEGQAKGQNRKPWVHEFTREELQKLTDGGELTVSFTDEEGMVKELEITSFPLVKELEITSFPLVKELEMSSFPYEKKNEKTLTIPEKTYTKWFDYDKIIKSLFLRTREMNDYLTVDENGSTKKLKDYLINEKVPKELRDRLPLLAEGHHILWVTGRRISQYYKVTEETTRILQVRIRGGADNGGDN